MKHALEFAVEFAVAHLVAFTPKGGCPLKLHRAGNAGTVQRAGSIHPQGWVPIETC